MNEFAKAVGAMAAGCLILYVAIFHFGMFRSTPVDTGGFEPSGGQIGTIMINLLRQHRDSCRRWEATDQFEEKFVARCVDGREFVAMPKDGKLTLFRLNSAGQLVPY
jgi:hypothetical protein